MGKPKCNPRVFLRGILQHKEQVKSTTKPLMEKVAGELRERYLPTAVFLELPAEAHALASIPLPPSCLLP